MIKIKKIIFTTVTTLIKFDTMEELKQYKKDNMYKNWKIKEVKKGDNYTLEVTKTYKEF